MRSSAVVTASTSTVLNSRGSLPQPARSLCTLRSVGYPSPRNTRFRLVASLCRAGLVTRWDAQRVSEFCYPLISSPLPRLRLAQHNYCQYLRSHHSCSSVDGGPCCQTVANQTG